MLCMRPTHFPAHRITKKEQKPIGLESGQCALVKWQVVEQQSLTQSLQSTLFLILTLFQQLGVEKF
jgi:hypothetical protein